QANQTTIVFDPTGEYAKLPNTITYRFGDNAYLDPGNLSWPQLQQLLQLPPVTQLQEQQIEQAIQTLRYQANVANVKQPWDWRGQAQATWEEMLRRLGSWSDSYRVT
ncbi:MAG: ATP-binding protein, partial [Limosilactobacillus sp.]|nr:ATP-binding protein [Limosilactobacillus sp.]